MGQQYTNEQSKYTNNIQEVPHLTNKLAEYKLTGL